MMIKGNLLVLPALSFGACLVHVAEDGDLASWDLGAPGPGVSSVSR